MCGESATEREPVTSHRKKRLHLGCEDRDTQLGEIKSTATALPEVFAGRGRVDRSGMPSFLLYRTGDGRHCTEQMNEEGEGRWQPRRTGKKGSEVGKGGEGRPLNRHPDHHRHRRRVALSPIPSSLHQSPLHLSFLHLTAHSLPSFLPSLAMRCASPLPPSLPSHLTRRNEINADEWFPSFPLTFASIIRDGGAAADDDDAVSATHSSDGSIPLSSRLSSFLPSFLPSFPSSA